MSVQVPMCLEYFHSAGFHLKCCENHQGNQSISKHVMKNLKDFLVNFTNLEWIDSQGHLLMTKECEIVLKNVEKKGQLPES